MSDNREQIVYWNGEGGRRWVRSNRIIDDLISPLGDATLDAAELRRGMSALDIGCGCGNQTLALARRIGPGGRVLGVDVSQPMLALAHEQASADPAPRATLEFLCADAAVHVFAPASADLLFSRFGVMFFVDPVAAFANMRGALVPGGRVVFCCWRPMQENELTTLPLQAALAHLPAPEPVPPDAPGPFAFADRERVRRILQSAGFDAVTVEPLVREIGFGAGLGVTETASRMLEIGPASRLLEHASAELRARVTQSLCAAIESRCGERGLVIEARCWLVAARAP